MLKMAFRRRYPLCPSDSIRYLNIFPNCYAGLTAIFNVSRARFGPPRLVRLGCGSALEKYLQLQLTMDQESRQIGELPVLLAALQLRDLYTVVSYLDCHTIAALLASLPLSRAGKFMQVVRITHFLRRYLTRTDRSLYMPFYSESSFAQIENEVLRAVTGHSAPALSCFLTAYHHIRARMLSELQELDSAAEVVSELVSSLVDPELPFPKLRKQTVGSHCNSAFQYYLVDKLVGGQQDEPDQVFMGLREFLSERQESLGDETGQEQGVYWSVLCEWFKITYENFQDFLIPGSTLHNFIVLVVAYVDLLVDSTRFFIEAIKDPLHRFVEFNLRYCMLRNAILSLEDRLGFLFTAYSGFCLRVLKRRPEAREMTVWHVMLSKWYLHMHRHHEQFFRMFFYLLRKVNLEAVQEEIGSHLDEDEAFIELKNRLELADVDLLEREEWFEVYSPLEEYFEEDCGLYKQLIQEYMEYKIDISVNEYSVHWCGFSDHDLHLPYRDFETLFLPSFTDYLHKLTEVARGVPRAGTAVDKALCAMLEQIDCDFLKPVTLKKVLKLVQEEAAPILGIGFDESSLGRKIAETVGYFSITDKKLQICNQQHNINKESAAKFSIIVENEDFNKMLKDSASTSASRPFNSKFLAEYQQEEDFIDDLDFC